MGNKKLVIFQSLGGKEHSFYALVNAHTDDLVIQELTCAAISDANWRYGRLSAYEPDPITVTIKRLLTPLGFEFIDGEAAVKTIEWDNCEQTASLLAIRILHEGYASEENEDGTLHVCTDKGFFKVNSICKDADVGWEYLPDKNDSMSLKESGFDQLITLLNNEHTQSSSVHWR